MNLKEHATNVRKNIIDMVYAAQSGHPGGSLSGADIITYLYFDEMNINTDNASSNNRDRFVLSKGHASPLLYGILMEKGIISTDLIPTFRQVDSKLQGHPNMNYVEGVDMSTGSLGQGISCAVGMAIANKVDNSPNRVYAMLGDGECEEGQVWEAAMAAAHYKLDNLCAVVDFNGLQIDGNITDVMNPTPIDEKFAAFGWNVVHIDGHDFDDIRRGFDEARNCKGKPTMILAKTTKGKCVSFMEGDYGWHGVAPNKEQYEAAMECLRGGSK
ncbi:transketolase [Breznakia blatticola]|uniref:Transketolase n=1 Tax=Breznakia blatticola TaxID=1754012 RepID=A0A4R8A4N2_9FIRM|nr:transketolase [Breznakia blatticola]TDW25562.1 transketolase [Breznakia blatticola]